MTESQVLMSKRSDLMAIAGKGRNSIVGRLFGRRWRSSESFCRRRSGPERKVCRVVSRRRLLRGFQQLEDRELLAAPELAPIAPQTIFAGAPLYVPLNGYDPDGDVLSFSAAVVQSSLHHSSIASPVLTPIIDHDNRNLRLTVRDFGDMVFELFERWAPRTTGRIIELVQQGFYTNVPFHRIIQHFVIQGGDPTSTGAGGSGTMFDDEFHPYLMHTGKGVLSMAKSTDDTNDSQFFITATDTRHLDFNHSVFGFLVRGEEVRQQIAAVPVDINNRPVSPVVIESAEIIYDGQNRVLVLIAPLGTTGWAEVKVTVSDPEGNTAEQTFQVSVQTDPYNSNAYLLSIAPIWTRAELPVTVAIAAFDREENPLVFAATPGPGVTDLSVSIDPTTGVLTVTPRSGAVGVRSVIVGVSDPSSYTADLWDTQVVPVYIRPPTPTVQLLSESDTGQSQFDRITRLNNSPGASLGFEVLGLVPGAEVSVLIDDVVVGIGIAQGTSLIVYSTSEFTLTDGPHKVTAVQVLRDQSVLVGNYRGSVTLWSEESTPLWIVIDTVPPVFVSQAPTQAAEGRLYEYQVVTLEEVAGPIYFELLQAPVGMRINASSGLLSWLPEYGQAGAHEVVVQAIDVAGNLSQQRFTIVVAKAPEFRVHPLQSLVEEQPWMLQVEVVADNLPVSLGILGTLPQGMTFDPVTQVLAWTPTEEQGPGLYQVVLEAEDSAGLSRIFTLTLVVAEDNRPPLLRAVDEAIAREHELFELQLVAEDHDLPAQELIFSLIGEVPDALTLDPVTGILRWRPTELHGSGQYPVTVRVTDSLGAWDEKTFLLLVEETYDPPVWETTGPFQAVVGSVLRAQFRAFDPDIPPAPLRYRLLKPFEGMTLDENTGELEWELTRERWQALGMPDKVTIAIEAYKLMPREEPRLSSIRRFDFSIIDPYLKVMAAWGLWQNNAGESVRHEHPVTVASVQPTANTPVPPRRLFIEERSDEGSDEIGLTFANVTGRLTRPSGALGITSELLEMLDKIEEDFLRRQVPPELLEDLLSSPNSFLTPERSQEADGLSRELTSSISGSTSLAESDLPSTTDTAEAITVAKQEDQARSEIPQAAEPLPRLSQT